jgi:hypothetical protein
MQFSPMSMLAAKTHEERTMYMRGVGDPAMFNARIVKVIPRLDERAIAIGTCGSDVAGNPRWHPTLLSCFHCHRTALLKRGEGQQR